MADVPNTLGDLAELTSFLARYTARRTSMERSLGRQASSSLAEYIDREENGRVNRLSKSALEDRRVQVATAVVEAITGGEV